MHYCLVCPFVCLFVRHMCVRAYLFEPNFSLFHHVKHGEIYGFQGFYLGIVEFYVAIVEFYLGIVEFYVGIMEFYLRIVEF